VPAPAPRADRRLYGFLLVAGSSILWSTAGLFTRAITLDLWTMVAWRSLFACATLLLIAYARSGLSGFDARRRLGTPGLVYVPMAAFSMVGYIAALRLTSVANVMTIFATMPFLAAGIAYLLLRERLSRDAAIASGVAFAGVAVMAGLSGREGALAGNLLALAMTAGFAGAVVMARRWRDLDVTLATACASGLCAIGCGLLAAPGVPAPDQLVLLFLFSLATQSLSYLMFLAGGRHLRAAESGLIALLDVILAPLWVWIAFAERPGFPALLGGGVTLLAVTWYMGRQLARRPRAGA
jgi:drug/metabolite transporter (DMT)-like permease